MRPRVKSSLLFVLTTAAFLPNAAFAQSAIAGVVRDTTGAVLPGVTVEASSPVLIEKVRAATTDSAGVYRVVDLRPGVYTVRFSLPGFNTFVREQLELPADFTAPLNVEMRVGGVEETVTVSGASPVVDVQTVTRRDVLSRELIDALPTGRNFQTAGATMPSVSMGRFDVGGSTAMQTGNTLVAAGSRANDTTEEVDGMGINSALGSSSNVPVYLNNAVYAEQVYTLVGGGADVQTPGVRINLIPKAGGNDFSGTAVAIFANTDFQAVNITPEEAARQGQTSAARLDKLWDYNFALGGPIMRDRLWFYGSVRNWGYNNLAANALLPDGSQAVDTNRLEAYNLRLTSQLSQKHKVTAMYDKFPKYRGRRNIELGTYEPEATYIQRVPLAYNAQAKWSATFTDRLLVEAGWSTNFYNYWLSYQPEAEATASNPVGVISKVDLNTNRTYDAARNFFNSYFDRDYLVSSASYVTGTHTFKVGQQFSTGWVINKQFANGDLFEQYRGVPGQGGIPTQVSVYNTPTFNRTDLDADLGIYAQDSWTLNRVTLSPGIRWDLMRQSVAPTSMPAGRFVPARSFDAIPKVADWTSWSPRIGVAWDVFGTGKTAIRFSAGKYMERDSTAFASNYNPSALSTDVRTWNGARDAQGVPTNLGPSTNTNFGIRAVNTRAEDLQRPYQTVYNWSVQQEVAPRTAIAGNVYIRKYRNIHGTINTVVPQSAFFPRDVADPRGNGEVITIYDILPQWLGQLNQNLQTVSSDINSRSYVGYDILLNSRLPNGATINGGVSVGRFTNNQCDVFNPNDRRFCDTSLYDIPWQPTYKINGVYFLPHGIRFSGVFQSALFEYSDTYLINRAVVPGLVMTSVNPQLNPPGSTFYPRANQLDIGIAKTFRVGRTTIIPTVEFFNLMNSDTVQTWVTAFGPNLHNVNTNMLGRLIRPQITVNW
jgi:hypothetical protein